MARQLICDPEMPSKSLRGDVDGIRKCIACEDGCCGQAVQFQPVSCIQNPAVGKEKELGIGSLRPAERKKRIVVVGGGVAGMKFSEIAAKRGHEIVLYEKGAVLGGQLNLVKKIPFRNEFSEVSRYLEFQLRGLPNVELHLSEEATVETITGMRPDAVVVATGSTRYVPEELRTTKSCSSWEVLTDSVPIGRNVVIHDKLAKDEGMGVAEYLTEYYEEVSIRFFTPAAYPGMDVHFLNQDVLFRKLFSKRVVFYPFYDILEASEDKVVFQHRYSRKRKTVRGIDNLVLVGDMRSNAQLYTALRGSVKELHRLGDARAPRVVMLAIHGAEELARAV